MRLCLPPVSACGLAALLLLPALSAQAEPWAAPVSQHPAMVPGQVLPGLDARLALIGHPASPRTRGLATAPRDHPAVATAQRARAGETPLDPNTFRVLPPASTAWTGGPAAASPVALLTR